MLQGRLILNNEKKKKKTKPPPASLSDPKHPGEEDAGARQAESAPLRPWLYLLPEPGVGGKV